MKKFDNYFLLASLQAFIQITYLISMLIKICLIYALLFIHIKSRYKVIALYKISNNHKQINNFIEKQMRIDQCLTISVFLSFLPSVLSSSTLLTPFLSFALATVLGKQSYKPHLLHRVAVNKAFEC